MAGGTLSLANYRDQEAAGINQELADLRHSFVIRQGKALPVNFERLLNHGDLSQNIYLQPDDFVYIPAARAKVVYVLGAVTQPRSIAYSEGMTVAGAVASAYGTLKGAYMHHVTVIRGSLTEPQVTTVDYKNVIKGEAQDMALLPHDIVYVPFSPYRYLERYIEIAINTFASAAAINAGEAAVTNGKPAVASASAVLLSEDLAISIWFITNNSSAKQMPKAAIKRCMAAAKTLQRMNQPYCPRHA